MLGDKIKTLRISQGLTQTAFAKRLFVTPGAVSQWEKGITRPDTERLMAIAKEFSVPLSYFSDDTQMSEGELIKQQLLLKLSQPKTIEAVIVSGGMDQLPKQDRETILNVIRAMYPNRPDLFPDKKGEEEDDNNP